MAKNTDPTTGEVVKRTRRVIPRSYYVAYAADNGQPVTQGPFGHPEFALGFIAGVENVNPTAFGVNGARVVELAEKEYTRGK